MGADPWPFLPLVLFLKDEEQRKRAEQILPQEIQTMTVYHKDTTFQRGRKVTTQVSALLAFLKGVRLGPAAVEGS